MRGVQGQAGRNYQGRRPEQRDRTEDGRQLVDPDTWNGGCVQVKRGLGELVGELCGDGMNRFQRRPAGARPVHIAVRCRRPRSTCRGRCGRQRGLPIFLDFDSIALRATWFMNSNCKKNGCKGARSLVPRVFKTGGQGRMSPGS